MKFKPTSAEVENCISYLGTADSDLTSNNLIQSGSHWNVPQLQAFHVMVFDNMPVSRLFAEKWQPHHSSNIYKELKTDVSALSRDDLHQWSRLNTEYASNKFVDFFRSLYTATLNEKDAFTLAPEPEPATTDDTPSSESSHSSGEDQPETPSRLVLYEFLEALAKKMFEAHNRDYELEIESKEVSLKLYIGPEPRTPLRKTVNDGGIMLRVASGHGGSSSNMHGLIPIVSFEAKRRHADGVARHTGGEESYNSHTFGQEFAELLATALNEHRAGSKAGDQESFVLTIHGTQLRLAVAYFTKEYLGAAQSAVMPASQRVHVRRSRFFELKNPDDRVAAMRLCVGLMRYVLSGDAAIEQLKGVSKLLKKQKP